MIVLIFFVVLVNIQIHFSLLNELKGVRVNNNMGYMDTKNWIRRLSLPNIFVQDVGEKSNCLIAKAVRFSKSYRYC